MAPLLSVVIPVYRVEDYLAACLDSVLADAVDGVEVVAVDDHSPDGCGKLLDAYAARDQRVRVVHLPANVGLGPARNAGLEHAAGEYVWFVDSDDWLAPGSVPAVVERLQATRPDVLFVNHADAYADGRLVPAAPPGVLSGSHAPAGLDERPELLQLAQGAWNKVVRRGLLDEQSLRFHTGWYEDVSYTYPLLLAARRIDVLDRVCYYYRRRPGGITTTTSPRHFEIFDQYRRVFEFVDRGNGAYERFRPLLFRIMINHYLVVAGAEHRLPDSMRRKFFERATADYRRWFPPGGYPVPGGVAGLKHRLLARGAFRAYAALRTAYRAPKAMRRAVVTRQAVEHRQREPQHS